MKGKTLKLQENASTDYSTVGFSFLPPAYPAWVDRIPRGKRINRFSERQKQPIPNITFSDLSGNGGYSELWNSAWVIAALIASVVHIVRVKALDSTSGVVFFFVRFNIKTF